MSKELLAVLSLHMTQDETPCPLLALWLFSNLLFISHVRLAP